LTSKRTVTVAFQGEAGAFSEQAASVYFGKSAQTLPCRSFADVFRAVESRQADRGLIPIENTVFGSIHENYDLLQRSRLHIVGEIKLRVIHALLVNAGVRLKDIRYIYSHPQALGQCERFLASLHNVEVVAVYDTAGAAKMIKEEKRKDAAAIASLRAAQVYGLQVLKKEIESNRANFTRFLALSRVKAGTPRHAKTSIVFGLKDAPGALYKALSVFALRDVNLLKIESRPFVGKPWEYLFYVDIEGSMNDAACKLSIRHLGEISSYLRILGTYEIGKVVG
jgi:prephenate dehydratase